MRRTVTFSLKDGRGPYQPPFELREGDVATFFMTGAEPRSTDQEGSGLVIEDAELGRVTLTLSAEETGSLPAKVEWALKLNVPPDYEDVVRSGTFAIDDNKLANGVTS